MGVLDFSITGIGETKATIQGVQTAYDEATDAVYVASPKVDYAVFQEQGTSSIPARPFMKPARERVQQNQQAMYEQYKSEKPDADPVEVIALAVREEAKAIADKKGVRDTGKLIRSISYEQVA